MSLTSPRLAGLLGAILGVLALAAPAAADLRAPLSQSLTLSQRVAGDTSPPVLQSFSVTPSSVDVTTASQTVTVSMRITDASGLDGLPTLTFEHRESTQTFGYGDVPRTSGTATDGTYSRTITVPQGSAPGTWDATLFPLRDTEGNSNNAFTTPGTLTVVNTGPADVDPPVRESFSIAPKTVDVTSADQTVTVTLRVTDATGAELPTFVLDHRSSSETLGFGTVPRTSGTATDGTYSTTITIPQGTPPGTWDANLFPLEDTRGNRGDFATVDTITVVDSGPPPADTEAPRLEAGTISPEAVDVTSSAKTVTVSLHVTDATGTQLPSVALEHQGSGTTVGSGTVPRTSGTATDGVYSRVITIPQGSPGGTWDVVVAPLEDTAGNTGAEQIPDTLSVTSTGLPAGGAASISGTPRIGQTLTCNTSGWSNSPSSFSYAWLRDGSGAALATTQTYVVAAADGGHELVCRAVASNANGSSAPATSAPVSVVAPPSGGNASITGTPRVGQTLTCNTSGWSGSPTGFTYAWRRDDAPLATGQTYVVAAADAGHQLTCRVVASNAGGDSAPATSAAVSVVAPPAGGSASITGTPRVGQTLTCNTSGWSGSPTAFTYAWRRDDAPLAAGQTYVVATADTGHQLTCRVVATNAGGDSAPASSAAVSVVAPPFGGSASISGTPRVGQTLTCNTSGWSGSPTGFTYAWRRDDAPLAAGQAYVVAAADAGHQLTCRVVASNAGGDSAPATSAAVSVVAPPSGGSASISGTPRVGQALTCNTSGWSGAPTSFTYAWRRDDAPLATGQTYVVAAADAGHQLACRVVASNAGGDSAPATSAAVSVVAPPSGGTAAIRGTPKPGERLTCETAGWSGSPTSLTFSWRRDGVALAEGSTYDVVEADVGHQLVCSVVATNAGGDSAPASSAPVPVVAADTGGGGGETGGGDPAPGGGGEGSAGNSDAPGPNPAPGPGPDPGPGPGPSPEGRGVTPPNGRATARQIGAAAKARRAGALLLTGVTPGGKLRVSATTPTGARMLRVFALQRTLAPGAFRVTLKPSAKAKRLLRRRKRLRIELAVSFTPAGGTAGTTSRTLTLRR